MMSKYDEFRDKYPSFYYRGFEIEDSDDYIFVVYHFEILNLEKFNPTLKIPKNQKYNYDKSMLESIVFSVGLAEIASYWKATCSPKIIIECGLLDDFQTEFLKKLLYHGLGEFFYVNNIDVDYDNFVSIHSSGKQYVKKNNSLDRYGYMVAVGGGKDSITSLEILKDKPLRKAFIINNRKVCFESAKLAGINDSDIINVSRVFDSKIIDLNNRGFLNGHTPLSSCIAFISYLTAYINGLKYAVLSNESSANEASVKGSTINHQYSKSFEFENDFREYVERCLDSSVVYFSLLRPLNELQIMSIFTRYPKYFKSFISCNNGGKRKNIGIRDGWCLECSKCLFIYILMSNFLTEDILVDIFGKNLLDDENMLEYFLELLGEKETKPFECVGTIDEVRYVVNSLICKNEKLPYLLDYYKKNYNTYIPDKSIFTTIDTENNVPLELLNIIKEMLSFDR